jgi:phage protein D
MVGGAVLAGAVAVELEQVGYAAAARFALSLAMGDAPLGNAAYFAALGLQMVTIDAGMAAAGFVNLLTGQIDNVRIDLGRRIAVLSGRDLSARLIDAQTAETFANQTASQIATILAARHGLTANITTTTTPVGQYYELDHAHTSLGLNSRNGSEWTLLARLAAVEDFALSVTGTTLNFGPAPGVTPVLVNLQDFIEILIDTATTLPTGATVKSWNTRNKAVVTQSSGVSGGGMATLIRPNLTSAQAQAAAASHLAAVGRHITVFQATMPGDVNLAPLSELSLTGTDSALDQIYVIDSMRRSIDARRGFIQQIHAYARQN